MATNSPINNYSPYQRSPRRVEYSNNKDPYHINYGSRYEDLNNQPFPTIHENKRFKGVTQSSSMRTVGVLDYTSSTKKARNNMRSEKENVHPQRGEPKHRPYDQANKYGSVTNGKSYPPVNNSPRKINALNTVPYETKGVNRQSDRDGRIQYPQTQKQGKPFQAYPKRGITPPRGPYMDRSAVSKPYPSDSNRRVYDDINKRPYMEENDPPQETEMVAPTKEGLSMQSKLEVLIKNRQLIYQETVWTKKRLEKLRATGFGDETMMRKIKASKEERRWDHIMKYLKEDPTTVQNVWVFIQTDYHRLYELLNEQYLQIIRNHFKPTIANLQTTPRNSNKMVDILVEQAEQYDRRIFELDQSLTERERTLDEAMAVLVEARKVVYDWGGREVPELEYDEDVATVSQELLDTVVVISAEKNQELANHIEENAELKKKVSRLGKALKEKDRQLKDSRSKIQSQES